MNRKLSTLLILVALLLAAAARGQSSPDVYTFTRRSYSASEGATNGIAILVSFQMGQRYDDTGWGKLLNQRRFGHSRPGL